jgi:hypothetical protein
MTAINVITEHGELENSGQVPHSVIDDYINLAPVIAVSGAIGPRTPATRNLKAGNGISIVDGGPGGDIVIHATNIPSPSGVQIAWSEKPSGNTDGFNNLFILQNVPNPTTSLMFFCNGVLQQQGISSDYTLSGSVVNLATPPVFGSNVLATYQYSNSSSSNIAWADVPAGANNGINQDFTLANIPFPSTALMFFYNGALLEQNSDYTIVNSLVHLLFVPKENSNFLATYPY